MKYFSFTRNYVEIFLTRWQLYWNTSHLLNISPRYSSETGSLSKIFLIHRKMRPNISHSGNYIEILLIYWRSNLNIFQTWAFFYEIVLNYFEISPSHWQLHWNTSHLLTITQKSLSETRTLYEILLIHGNTCWTFQPQCWEIHQDILHSLDIIRKMFLILSHLHWTHFLSDRLMDSFFLRQ